jgi:hypothetical protein
MFSPGGFCGLVKSAHGNDGSSTGEATVAGLHHFVHNENSDVLLGRFHTGTHIVPFRNADPSAGISLSWARKQKIRSSVDDSQCRAPLQQMSEFDSG